MTTHIRAESATTTAENFNFSFDDDSQTATVMAYLGNITNVVIPATVNRQNIPFQVTAIGANAFRNTHLRSVQLPNTILAIREAAFQNNKLKSLVIPNSIIQISANAFRENKLTDVVLPNTLEVIGNHAFFRNQLQNINLPSTLTHIGESAFARNALTHLTLPQSLISIGNSAFSSNKLTSVHLPEAITLLGNSVFYNNRLTEVTLPPKITQISDSLFYHNRLTHITLPNTVTSIGNNAFRDNLLTSIELPNSVTNIGNSAFRTNSLVDIRIPSSVSSIGQDALTNLPLASIYTDEGNGARLTQMLNLHTMRNLRTTQVTLFSGQPFFRVEYINTPLNPVVTVGDNLTFSVDIQVNHYYTRGAQTDKWVCANCIAVSIQWYKAGQPLPGENNSNLQLIAIQKDQADIYYAVVNSIKLPDIHLVVEENNTSNTKPDFTYRINNEGERLQTLIITNQTATNVATHWNLQLTYTGPDPMILWPADWQRGERDTINTTVNDPLLVNQPLALLLDDSLTTHISSVRINGNLACRES